MIVEDEEIVAADIQMSVEKMGYSVCATASSGIEAIKKANLTRPDLILMDIVLKGVMDGIEAATEIKTLYKIPVVYLTAFGEDSILKRAKIAEPYGYILKPFRDKDLQIVIEISIYKKQAEARIKKIENWLATILKSIGDAVIASDKERRITFMNSVAEKLTGWNKEDALGKKLTEVLNIKDQNLDDLEKYLVEKVITEGLIINLIEDRLLIAKDGTELSISDSIAPIKYDNDETTGSVIVFRDITDHKSAKEALIESEERYRTVFNSAGDAILIHGEEALQMLAVNTMACNRLGYTHAELMSMKISQIDSPDEAQHIPERVQRLMKLGHIIFETVHMRKDGSLIPTEVSVRRITWGGQTSMISICRDITDRKIAESEHLELEHQYRHAQKMEAIGRLAGGVAHDFNNMLGIIMGYAELTLMKLNPSDPLYDDINEILNAAKRSSELTRQLLAFSRNQKTAPQVINLNDRISQSEKMLRRLIGEDIEFKFIQGTDLCTVEIDPSQIDQILANLAVNSRDAIVGVGSIVIETSNAVLDQAFCNKHPGITTGVYVLISFKDSGFGMNNTTMERIFEPFFSTKGDRGTGLGLSTVYGIITQNKGFVDVYSEEGKGTTFKIYIPRCDKNPEVTQEIIIDKSLKGTETILVVEDEESILRFCKRVLEEYSYKVITATNPGEAIVLTEKHKGKIHVIITDVIMPYMNGKELSERIKLLMPGIEVIFMSGYTADIIDHLSVLDENQRFIHKPFLPENLLRIVRKVLDL